MKVAAFTTRLTMDHDPAQNHTNHDYEDQLVLEAHEVATALGESVAEDSNADTNEEDTPLVCRICGRGDEEGRPILRFLPVHIDDAAALIVPGVDTFTEDISLHIFCGKTASILPHVNRPDLEILTKAGLKNKHGIGPDVNAALARTRCAILAQEGAKEKQFYLVREFEAHLNALRQTNHHHIPLVVDDAAFHHEVDHLYETAAQTTLDYDEVLPPIPPTVQHNHHHQQQQQQNNEKNSPYRASAGRMQKAANRSTDDFIFPLHAPENHDEDDEDEQTNNSFEKVRCQCGGTHLPTGTAKGVQSWRNHLMTKRHQKWAQEHEMTFPLEQV